ANEDTMTKFLRQKIEAKPTSIEIPYAISMKFKHRDNAFFRSFTRNLGSRPAYQIEFNTLMNSAIETYKRYHNVLITNKVNRDQVFMMLRKKLAIDFLLNLNLLALDSFEATKYINYLIGFAKIQTTLKFDEINKIIKEVKSERLQPLPDNPDQICDE